MTFMQVGLPKVGKSTLLEILAKSFTSSIEKQISREVKVLHVNLPDPIFYWLCKHYNPVYEVSFLKSSSAI
jgi:predicted ATPase